MVTNESHISSASCTISSYSLLKKRSLRQSRWFGKQSTSYILYIMKGLFSSEAMRKIIKRKIFCLDKSVENHIWVFSSWCLSSKWLFREERSSASHEGKNYAHWGQFFYIPLIMDNSGIRLCDESNSYEEAWLEDFFQKRDLFKISFRLFTKMLTATFLQRINRRNRVYQLERLKGFLGTVPRDVKGK